MLALEIDWKPATAVLVPSETETTELPPGDSGVTKVAVKCPALSLWRDAGLVAVIEPPNFTLIGLLAKNPLPLRVTDVPAVPLAGVARIVCLRTKVAWAVIPLESWATINQASEGMTPTLNEALKLPGFASMTE